MLTHIAPPGADCMPLKRYLRRAYPLLPDSTLRSLFRARDVKINGVRVREDAVVRAGDEIRLYLPDAACDFSLKLLGRENGVIAFVKPPMLPVDRDADGLGEDTVLSRLLRISSSARLVHRLDAGTGGVMLAAEADEAEKRLLRAFQTGDVRKKYLCVSRGAPKDGLHEAYLRKDAQNALVTVLDRPSPDALRIAMKTRRLAGAKLCLTEIELLTGRTHQIRAHMARLSCPLLGDDKYGDRALNRRLAVSRIRLWCREIAWENFQFAEKPGDDFYTESWNDTWTSD